MVHGQMKRWKSNFLEAGGRPVGLLYQRKIIEVVLDQFQNL